MLVKAIEMTAKTMIEAEAETRAELAALLTTDRVISSSHYEAVMKATAAAKPWRDVLRIAETKTHAEAITAVRERAITALLEYGESRSTSGIRNEEERMEREGLRSFLSRSSRLVERFAAEEAEQAAEAPAAQPEQPARKPSTRKPSDAQIVMLHKIREGGVSIRMGGYGKILAFGPKGRENIAVVRACIVHGWAVADTSTSINKGQAITLTDAGRARI